MKGGSKSPAVAMNTNRMITAIHAARARGGHFKKTNSSCALYCRRSINSEPNRKGMTKNNRRYLIATPDQLSKAPQSSKAADNSQRKGTHARITNVKTMPMAIHCLDRK